jgi:hypothetical protein
MSRTKKAVKPHRNRTGHLIEGRTNAFSVYRCCISPIVCSNCIQATEGRVLWKCCSGIVSEDFLLFIIASPISGLILLGLV